MRFHQKYLNGLLFVSGILLFTGVVISMLIGSSVQPAQARAAKTRTPTPISTHVNTSTPTPLPTLIHTPTPTAVSSATPTVGPTSGLVGSWKIVDSPNVGTGTFGNQLNAVAVVSVNDAWAVGFSPHPSGYPLYIRQTLIEHWDGNSWSVVASPNPVGKTFVVLNGVAAISASDIWAVGHSGDPGSVPLETLTQHWDGTSWSIVPSPSPGTYNGNILYAVAAISSDDVWAVGWYQSGSYGELGGALTMHWDGSSWTVVPNPGRWALYGVAVIASNNVWAVGEQNLLHWNGISWSIVAYPPPPGDSYQIFKGISATSTNDIWAVGYSRWSYFYGYRYVPITYHWNGNSWSWIPNAGGLDEYLFSVTAISPNDVWAVGDNGQTQHWNGATWSRVAAPYPGLGGRFNGIDAASTSDIWAVGYYNDGSQNRTWIDRYTVP